tara:strand:+ start:2223 stop:2417 length:195 start_codon:yes stop_codon:yes gene_type:complete
VRKVKAWIRFESSKEIEFEIPDDCVLEDAHEHVDWELEDEKQCSLDGAVVYYIEDPKTGETWEK